MSYCRWSRDCEVYMYESIYGGFTFVTFDSSIIVDTRADAIALCERLRDSGVKFPHKGIIAKLQEEIDQRLPEPVWDGKFL